MILESRVSFGIDIDSAIVNYTKFSLPDDVRALINVKTLQNISANVSSSVRITFIVGTRSAETKLSTATSDKKNYNSRE